MVRCNGYLALEIALPAVTGLAQQMSLIVPQKSPLEASLATVMIALPVPCRGGRSVAGTMHSQAEHSPDDTKSGRKDQSHIVVVSAWSLGVKLDITPLSAPAPNRCEVFTQKRRDFSPSMYLWAVPTNPGPGGGTVNFPHGVATSLAASLTVISVGSAYLGWWGTQGCLGLGHLRGQVRDTIRPREGSKSSQVSTTQSIYS